MAKFNSHLMLTAEQLDACTQYASEVLKRDELRRAHDLQQRRQQEFREKEFERNDEVCRNNPELNIYCPMRIADHSNFDYQLRHRQRYAESVIPSENACKQRLEWIAEKVNATNLGGSPCIFSKWFNYADYASIIALACWRKSDSLCACGTPIPNRRNKRFNCGDTLFCPLCNWKKILKDRIRVFGEDSGTFEKADRWFFITLSFTTDGEGERYSSVVSKRSFDRTFSDEPLSVFSEGNANRPVSLEGDPGYDVELMFKVCRRTLNILNLKAKKQRIVDGYDYRHELAIEFNPNKCLPHIHAVANDVVGRLEEGEVAEILFEAMDIEFEKAKRGDYDKEEDERYGMIDGPVRKFCHGNLRPSIKVLRIDTAKSLERILKYIHKPIDILTPYLSACAGMEGLSPSAKANALSALNDRVAEISDQIGNAYHGTNRTQPVGNMICNRNCIGELPEYILARNRRGTERKAAKVARKLMASR